MHRAVKKLIYQLTLSDELDPILGQKQTLKDILQYARQMLIPVYDKFTNLPRLLCRSISIISNLYT